MSWRTAGKPGVTRVPVLLITPQLVVFTLRQSLEFSNIYIIITKNHI